MIYSKPRYARGLPFLRYRRCVIYISKGMDFFSIDIVSFLRGAGYLGIFAIIFAESGLLLGFFLPGDSLLFTAGFLASQGFFGVIPLIAVCFVGAVTGDSFGYAFGKKLGPRIFRKEESLLFHKDHLARAESFYEKHGKKTIVLARFLPVIRTFAPILAGVGKMHYRTFVVYNIVGSILWAIGIPLMGYYLGSIVPNVDRYIFLIIAGIIVCSSLPSVWHLVKFYRPRSPRSSE